ncbi:MAG: hypothetical protein OXT70_13045 [Chloroflexota bacterium]|nr:hypothetical protein [Chloroflexota bacterium]
MVELAGGDFQVSAEIFFQGRNSRDVVTISRVLLEIVNSGRSAFFSFFQVSSAFFGPLQAFAVFGPVRMRSAVSEQQALVIGSSHWHRIVG